MPQSKHLVPLIVARRNFFLITFNWLANALVYNGLSFYSADLGEFESRYFSTTSLSLVPEFENLRNLEESWRV